MYYPFKKYKTQKDYDAELVLAFAVPYAAAATAVVAGAAATVYGAVKLYSNLATANEN